MPLFTDLRSLEKLIKPQLGKEKPVHPHWDDKAVGKGLCGCRARRPWGGPHEHQGVTGCQEGMLARGAAWTTCCNIIQPIVLSLFHP